MKKGALIILILSFLVSGCAETDCNSFSDTDCPDACAVCPPCEVCSSIKCRSIEACENIGFSKDWYEDMKTVRSENDSVEEESDIKKAVRSAVDNATIEELPDWEKDDILLMRNEDGTFGCFGCSEGICVDPTEDYKIVPETAGIYCGPDFIVVKLDGDKAYDELVRLLKIFADESHDPVGEEREQELKERITEFENKGYEIKELWELHDIIAAKNGAIEAPHAKAEELDCIPDPDPGFTEAFTDISKIDKISPSGFWVTEDVFKGHSFIWTERENVPIYAPTDMSLTGGAFYTERDKDQYVLYFEVSCEVSVKFDHIHEPIEIIKEAFGNTPKLDTRSVYIEKTEFKAGDLIAYTRGNDPSGNWDFGVYNTAKRNSIPNLLHNGDKEANCPFDYYEDSSVYRKLYVDDSLLCE